MPLPETYPSDSALNQITTSAIREVFSYIKQYTGKTFVLKIEDALLPMPLFPLLMKDVIQLHDLGIKIVIVTGTRATIDRNLELAGLETDFVNGVRITPTQSMPHVKLAALEVAETIISHIAAGGANGIMGNWVKARSLGVCDGIDFQWTGRIEKIHTDILLKLISQAFIPVVVNLGLNSTGKCYNVNSNHIARQLCTCLGAEKLFIIGEDHGIQASGLIVPPEIQLHPGGILSNLDLDQVTEIIEKNPRKLRQQDLEYLENALKATTGPGGVTRVHIINGNLEGSLLKEVFSSTGGGTMIYRNKYARIRQARQDDIPAIVQLLEDYVSQGNLVFRSNSDIVERIDNYAIYEVDQVIYGCGGLDELGQGWAEIGPIAVHSSYSSKGVGHKLMNHLINKARSRKLNRLFLLTTQAADWFYEFGFQQASPADLPEPRRTSYNTRRNSRVLILNLTSTP